MFWCRHDWVIVRAPDVQFKFKENRPSSFYYEVIHNGFMMKKFSNSWNANEYAGAVADMICSKCKKLKLRLDDAAKKIEAQRKKEQEEKDNLECRRKNAQEYGKKLLNLADKAKE